MNPGIRAGNTPTRRGIRDTKMNKYYSIRNTAATFIDTTNPLPRKSQNSFRDEDNENIRGIIQFSPLKIAFITGLFWVFVYLSLGRLHGMWPMFDKEFPFLVASVFGVHTGTISVLTGAVLAFTDAVIVGFTLSLILKKMFLHFAERMKKGE